MLFVRCRGGISHNPAEHVETADADAGARVLLRLIEKFPAEGLSVGRVDVALGVKLNRCTAATSAL